MKAGLIAVVGRPSSGKSTLLNRICGHKVSITAPSPQTTRNTVRGIFTDERGQLVFLDTPGYHNSERKFNIYMKNLARSTLQECDLVLYIIDAHRVPGPEEEELMKLLQESKHPVVTAINKIDLNPAGEALGRLQKELRAHLPDSPVHAISALTGDGVEELMQTLFGSAPEGELMYPEEYYTDQEPEFRISEVIRENAVNRVRQELPHSIYVEIEDLEAREEEQLLWIRAVINVERESQKGMLVGKKGAMIKQIRKESERELAEIFPYRIQLDLRVKVDPKWRRKDQLLKRLIY
ncbi:MAG: GTPase Era [Spirochaetota bacterium]|nr:GTPase Era [Spirochaetota bacterium]